MNDQLSVAIELLERAGDILADVYSNDASLNDESQELAEEIQEFLVKLVQ